MNIKRIISIVLATIMLLQTVVFANEATFNSYFDYIENIKTISLEDKTLIEADDNLASVAVVNETLNTEATEELLATVTEETSELQVVDKGTLTLNELTSYTFDENVYLHRFTFELKSKSVVRFDVSFVPRSTNERLLINYNGLSVSGRKFLLKKGTYELSVRRLNGDLSSKLDYGIRIWKDCEYDSEKNEVVRSGIDVATGDYSETFDDVVTVVAGDEFKIQRRYNSNDDSDVLFNKGWSINYECIASYGMNTYELLGDDSEIISAYVYNENIIRVPIPSGNVFLFRKVTDRNSPTSAPRDRYLPLNSNNGFSVFNDYYVLTTTDGTKYYYETIDDNYATDSNEDDGGYLYAIVDLHGNVTQIDWDGNKLNYILDIAGNKYSFVYSGTNNKLSHIYLNEDKCLSSYVYDSDKKLVQSIDSSGREYTYIYDDAARLHRIDNCYDYPVSTVTYQVVNNTNCVYQHTDEYGATQTYSFYLDCQTTTVVSSGENGETRETIYQYDGDKNINSQVQVVDGKSLETSVERYTQLYPCIGYVGYDGSFSYDEYRWNNGRIEKEKDITGIVTEYIFQEYNLIEGYRESHGLPIAKKVFDTENNLIEHEEYEYAFGEILSKKKRWKTSEDYSVIEYLYETYEIDDSEYYGRVLTQIKEYPSAFCYENNIPSLITEYSYDENSLIKGLPISITYSNANGTEVAVWTYNYDDKGNLIEKIYPESISNVTVKETYEYNDLGLVSKHTSGEGVVTLYEYNDGLQETKKTVVVSNDNSELNEITRTIYNEYGYPVQIISPNQYVAANEKENGGYLDNTVGTRNEYHKNGLLEKTIDPEGNTTEYTYDCFGNVISKKMHNGSVYLYEYDELSNKISESFKETEASEEKLIETNLYSYGEGYTTCVNTKPNSLGVIFSMQYKYRYGNLLDSTTILFEDNELNNSPQQERVRKLHYDMTGKVICDFIKKTHWEWNATYYTYSNYDIALRTTYDEKFTLLESLFRLPASSEMAANGKYKYERTDYDKYGNVIRSLGSTVLEGSIPTLAEENVVSETSEYYADNLLKIKTDAMGVRTEYEYDKNRNLSKVTVSEPGKSPQIIAYINGHNGKPSEIRTYVYGENITDSSSLNSDELGTYALTTNTYDKNGNITRQVSSIGLTTEYEYDLNNLQTAIELFETDNEEATRQRESVEYDFAGNVIQQIDKKGNVTKFVYNGQGFLVYTIFPNGKVQLTTRDQKGRIVFEVNAVDYKGNASETNATMDTYITDLANIATMNRTEYLYYPYEPHDLMITAIRHTYNPDTNETSSVVKQIETYDYVGNLTVTEDAYGNCYGYEYNSLGNCIKYITPSKYSEYTDPSSHDGRKFTTFCEYDMLGRKIKEGNYYGDYYAYSYDKKGNILSAAIVEDGESQIISTYTYDNGGRLLTQTDGNGHTTTLVYDDNNRLMKQYAHGGANDDFKTDYYSYDILGNLTEHTTRNGDTIEYEYDVFNRLVKTTSKDGIVTYTYDKNSNILTMTDSTGTTTYTYDSMGRVLTKNHTETETETETEPKKVSYTYDIYENIPYGYVAEITTEWDEDTVEKWYDYEDKIVKVIDGTYVTEYTYYDDGRLKSTKKPDGSISTNTYDDEGNLLTLVTLDAAEDVLDSFTYVYDDNAIGYKNQISKTEIVAGSNRGTTSYEYDIQGRLTKVTNPDGSRNEYTYDNAGNRLTKKTVTDEGTIITTYTYDEQNRLTKAVTGNSTTYYGYDNNGNQISEWTRFSDVPTTNCGVELDIYGEEAENLLTLYEYDAFDRLIKIEQGADVIENVYTADGKKLSRTTNGDLTYYVYDGNVVIEEQDENNTETARNVYGRNLITRETDVNKIVYGYNGHGDVVYQANASGIVLVVYDYDEFGNVILEENVVNSVSTLLPSAYPGIDNVVAPSVSREPVDNPYRYAGYEYIEEIGIYDLNARYYNPEIARFLSQDPYYNLGNRVIGLYEINVPTAASIMQANALYAYCGNNPVRYNDPTGELFGITISILTIIKVASVVAGAAAAAYTAYQSHKYTGKIDWEATIFNGLSWGMMAYTLGMSAYAVYVDYCHYYGKTPVAEVKFNSQATIPTNQKASKNAETVTTNTRGESVPRINKESPIRIPKDATITPQQKNGYYQIKHNWTDDGYKYEARWHTKTPNAPRSQGDTWVVTRTTPGTPGNEKQVHYYTQSGWVSQTKWDEAIKARNAGTATTEQLELLASGHWPG